MSSPSRAANTELLSAIQDAKNRLPYLSPNDWALMIDRSKQVSLKKGQILIQQGVESKVMYIIAKGKVSVSVFGTSLGKINPGEICGEMAFLEGSIPSATATAEEPVQAFAIEWKTLTELFELFPHLASRFYRSLAVNLSRRLRDQLVPKKF
ncbi:MAG TPA: cyclic nucleotide-binding domain-containing protein [Terriglobales bacterium]|jgi:CRP-like cAMP-binding protein|nr:cyclic nucleotide-binding domain-containing protein [Terriglobales bacterium]